MKICCIRTSGFENRIIVVLFIYLFFSSRDFYFYFLLTRDGTADIFRFIFDYRRNKLSSQSDRRIMRRVRASLFHLVHIMGLTFTFTTPYVASGSFAHTRIHLNRAELRPNHESLHPKEMEPAWRKIPLGETRRWKWMKNVEPSLKLLRR